MGTRIGKKTKCDELLEAASAGNIRRIKKLGKELDNGKGTAEAIAKIRDSDGRGVLHVAAVKGRTNVCKYLFVELKFQADEKDEEDCTPLLHASLEGNLSTVECLIENGADPAALNKHNTTALHLAALEGNIEVVRFLLSRGADVNAPSAIGTPLQLASQLCDPDVLETLLDNGAEPNTVGLIPTPLDFCMSRSLECAQLLIQAGANPNGISCGMTPLASTAKKGDIEGMKCLLESGADPNITDDIGLKPIEIAARKGNHREVEALFPVTSRIARISDWTVTGIMKHVNSEQVKQEIGLRLKEKHFKAKSKGEDALNRNDYPQAAFYFTEAIASDPLDETVLAKRSHCLASLGDGGSAWVDAKACISMKPDWPEAYLRGGLALSLLEKFDMAADTFSLGMKLDPENTELRDAYQGLLKSKRCSYRLTGSMKFSQRSSSTTAFFTVGKSRVLDRGDSV